MTGLLVVAGTVLAGCQSATSARSTPGRGTSACTSSEPTGPVTVTLQSNLANDLIAPVCLNGHGPFNFLIDTGASASSVTTALARTLRLPASGSPQIFFGIGHSLSGQPRMVRSWSVGSIQLVPQALYASALNLPLNVEGLLGSDVLARFGTVRLDYDRGQLIVANAEGPALNRSVSIGSAHRLPSYFASYQPQAIVPMTVTELAGQAVAVVRVSVASKSLQMVLDTGAGSSAITTSATKGLALVPQAGSVKVQGVGGASRATLERVGTWAIGSVRLVPEDLISVQFPAQPTGILDGLIGADVLSQFRGVTIDYSHGLLGVDEVPVL